ncbi:MAG TPA: MFS transporter [Gaiellaceae bacterium]|nr:MFS transporter [Gaiellaceae bacterium]
MRERLPSALRLRGFAFLWTALLTNGFATQMIVVAIGWQVYAIRHRPLDLGLVGLAEFLPLPLLALPAGQLADRTSRRAVAAVAGALQVGIAGVLLAITAVGPHSIWPFLGVGLLNGITSAIGTPAVRALTPELVPLELLQGAIALRSLAGQIGVVAGPAIGGVIFAVEPLAVYATAAGLLTVAFLATLGIPRTIVQREPQAVGWETLVAGVRFITNTRVVLGAIALDLVAVLFGDAIALAPVFAKSILHGGPVTLGALRAAPSVGALLAGLLIARRPLPFPAGRTLLVVVATFGAATIVFGLSKSLPLSLVMLGITGFADMFSMNIRATAVAVMTPLRLQGRVNAVEWVFISASNELGAFEAGGMASLLGTMRAVVLGGALMIGFAASWSRLFPPLARLGRLDELRPEPT